MFEPTYVLGVWSVTVLRRKELVTAMLSLAEEASDPPDGDLSSFESIKTQLDETLPETLGAKFDSVIVAGLLDEWMAHLVSIKVPCPRLQLSRLGFGLWRWLCPCDLICLFCYPSACVSPPTSPHTHTHAPTPTLPPVSTPPLLRSGLKLLPGTV